MLSSKFIAHFLEEVSTWQRKLSTADQVITIWMEVQRTWSHLESIFIGSEDIRRQLPTDSARFDNIDFEFKVANCCLCAMLFNRTSFIYLLVGQPHPTTVGTTSLVGPLKFKIRSISYLL